MYVFMHIYIYIYTYMNGTARVQQHVRIIILFESFHAESLLFIVHVCINLDIFYTDEAQ
jgi:hypothetical protein